MTDAAERTYFWDFYGPRAEPTAQHFTRHLRGFLQQHGIERLSIVEHPHTPLHHSVGLRTPPEHRQLIEQALRPKRHA